MAIECYPRRVNLDGSIDSICSTCYATVASVRDIQLSAASENAHICDAVRVAMLRQDCSPPPRSAQAVEPRSRMECCQSSAQRSDR